MTSIRRRIVQAVAILTGCGAAIAPAPVSAQSPQPAFYTYQAPGGASTYGQRVIALTFDDGPGVYTPQVLSVLEQYHVPATFFEIGENVVQYPQYTRMLAAAGYPVEDHTWTHPDLSLIPVSEFPYEIDQTQNEIRSLTGVIPACVRPPYDDWDATVLDQIAERGLTTMSYSIDSLDWTIPGVQTIVDNVVGAAFPGAVVDMHDGGGDRSETVAALPEIITDLVAEGYTFVSICGSMTPPVSPQASAVFGFGKAPTPGRSVTSQKPFVGVATAPDGLGYWLTAEDGGVFSFDSAGFYGSLPLLKVTPNKPVVGMAATSDSHGYWLVAGDGGVFSFGDARYYGSISGRKLNAAIVGLAADSHGYWLVAGDGGVFSFGDARYYGSMAGRKLNSPIVGIVGTPDGLGYWLVASDGGVFSFGDAHYHGSMAGRKLNSPIVGIAADGTTGTTGGYWLVGSDGGVFSFDAEFDGSAGTLGTGDHFFAISSGHENGYLVGGEHPATTG